MSIPLGELAERLEELPADLEIVAYCDLLRLLPRRSVGLLNARGRRAVRLADGIVGWQASGEPLSTTAGA